MVRRAPKREVKVESAPLPAPKPRGYSSLSKIDEEATNPRAAVPASPDSAHDSAISAVSATNTNAPSTGGKETIAPFSSVLHESAGKRANGESNVDSYAARTTVEELQEEVESHPSPTPSEPPNVISPGRALPAASVAAVFEEERAVHPVPCSRGSINGCAAAGLLPMTTPTPAAVVTVPSAATSAAATPPPEVNVERDSGPPVSVDSEQGHVGMKHETKAEGPSGDSFASASREWEAESPSLQGKSQVMETSQPLQEPQKMRPSTVARASGSTSRAFQLPTTGYQFEHLWRSTDGSPEARLELLRAVPPSSVAKFFRRTPIEVDLLGGVLLHLGEAFLPKRPGTALRWLKSLSKASRFGMTVALLGETDGRAAAREVLTRLETAPPAKVDPQEIGVMKKTFLVG